MMRYWNVATVAAVGVMMGSVAEGAILVNEPVHRTESIGPTMLAAGMAGMRVTAGFADGSTATGLFGAGSIVVPNGFNLVVTRFGGGELDTSLAGVYWSLSNTNPASRLVSLEMDGKGDGAGNTVFDINGIFYGVGSTDGSGAGIELQPFQDNLTGPWTATVTYSGAVGLGDAAPVGDVYRYVSLTNLVKFSTAGLGFGDEIRFSQDSDVAVVTAVPEPGGVLWSGVGGVWVVRRRGRRGFAD